MNAIHLPVLHASSTSRWVNCAYYASRDWPRTEGSESAKRGTRIHGEIAFMLGKTDVEERAKYDDERELAKLAVRYVEDIRAQVPTWTMELEQKMVAFGGQVEGTADVIFRSPDRSSVIVIDWKTGQWHDSYRDQLRSYAVMSESENADVRLVFLGEGREEAVNLREEDLEQHHNAMRAGLLAREEKPDNAVQGAWCQWCPGEVECPKNTALAEVTAELVPVKIDVRALARDVSNIKDAKDAHALLKYAAIVTELVEANLKDYVRKNGPIQTREGQTYSMSKSHRSTVTIKPGTLKAISDAGASSAVKEAVTWSDLKKAVSDPGKLAVLEEDLLANGSLKHSEYEVWKTK